MSVSSPRPSYPLRVGPASERLGQVGERERQGNTYYAQGVQPILRFALLPAVCMAASGRTQGTSCLCREPCPELNLKVENLPPHPSPAHCPVCILLSSLPSIIIWFINAFTCLLSGSCKPITSVLAGVFVFLFLFFLPLLPRRLEPCLVCC